MKETMEESVQRKLMLSHAVAFDFDGGDDDEGFVIRATRDVVSESGWGFLRHTGHLEPINDPDLCPRILVEHDGPNAKEGLAWIPLRADADMSDDFSMITKQSLLSAFAMALELRESEIPLKEDERLSAQITITYDDPHEMRALFQAGHRLKQEQIEQGIFVHVVNLREKNGPDYLNDQIYRVAQAWPNQCLLEPKGDD